MAIAIAWSDAAVQAALISTIGTIFASTVAAVCAVAIGKRITDRDKLKEERDAAIEDVAFLLAVEEAHCDKHVNNGETSHKMIIRNLVREKGLVWSGKYTPGRVGRKQPA